MDPSFKPVMKKRVVVGWRQMARRVAENRSRHHRMPLPPRTGK